MGLNKIINPGEPVRVHGVYNTWHGTLSGRAYEGFTGTFTVILDGETEESRVVGTIYRRNLP